MIFQPQSLKKAEGRFLLCDCAHAVAHPCLNKEIFREFWHNFSFRSSSLTLSACDTLSFTVGDARPLPLDGYDYTVNIEPSGVCVCGKDEKALVNGFITLLDRFKAVEKGEKAVAEAECCQIRDRATVQNRMVHYCIFPETELWELQRFVRLCGALKYTHIVLEFWGMLKYDCMQALAWSHGFRKEQIKPIIREANELGLEVIPMFNHWGHASAGRVMHGKHVVLDQDPTLQTYFSEDGWCWDIRSPKVKALLREVRRELIELCGSGSYFHIGCDEAYNFEFTEENMRALCDFINEICAEMDTHGRRIFIWGDMLLFYYKHYNPTNKYTCNAPTQAVEQYFLSHLDRRIIIADWQYRAYEAPVETCSVFQKAGFDCVLCPWDEGRAQINAALATVKAQQLMGYMHTTWHTLSKGMPYVTLMALGGLEDITDHAQIKMRTYTAALLRKVMPADGDYQKAGWSKQQIDFRW